MGFRDLNKFNCALIGFLVFALTVATFLSFSIRLKDNNARAKHELDSLVSYHNEIANIQKTLLISANISKLEARYYAPIIYDFCNEFSIEYSLAIALINVESQWNPTLISSAKCRGLGQLGVAAAGEACSALGVSYNEGVTEWTDVLNLGLSLYYFGRKLQVSNSTEEALKRYIGGDGFKTAENRQGATSKMIKKYAQDVAAEQVKIKNILTEADKVSYIYKGILYERNIEPEEMSRTQRKVVRRMQEQNPTGPSIFVDTNRRDGSMQRLLGSNDKSHKAPTR